MSGKTATPAELRQLLIEGAPFLDVRAELEFAKGAFPGSYNLPILNDAERQQVGKCYKQEGQQQAIELGHRLVCGGLKEERIRAWCEFAQRSANTHLYCWRGGMRSHLTQQWMAAAGVDIPLIPGGYKALRRILIDELEAVATSSPLFIIGGKTGSAKTVLVNELPRGVDLEHHAHHRGSSFGRRVIPPPPQASFENALAIDILRRREIDPQAPLFLEDESRLVGPCAIPLPLFEAMKKAPLIVLEVPFEERVEHVLQEYVVDMRAEHEAADSESGYSNYREYLLASLYRIRKRLGMQRYQQLEQQMQKALDLQLQYDDPSLHRQWIAVLLREYYDPMYEYQLSGVGDRLAYRGDRDAVLAWCREAVST